MAVCAQQLKVTGIRRPILEAARPDVLPVFGAYFFGWVDVVDIQRAVIIKAALRTLAAKVLNQRQLAFPIARTLVDAVPVLVPVVAQAGIRAEARRAARAAILALSGVTPSVREVACLTAELPGSIANAIGVHLRRLAAVRACDFSLGGSHNDIIPKYFDIACRRIEDAQRQQRLFA